MKLQHLLIVPALLLAGGCGGDGDSSSTPPTPPPATQSLVPDPAPAPVAAAPAPNTPPPPPGSASAPAPAGPNNTTRRATGITEAQRANDSLAVYRKDEESGKMLSDIEALQKAIDAYNRIQPMSKMEEDKPGWPELDNDLSVLVKVRLLRALPNPPAGQSWVYDRNTGKVSAQ